MKDILNRRKWNWVFLFCTFWLMASPLPVHLDHTVARAATSGAQLHVNGQWMTATAFKVKQQWFVHAQPLFQALQANYSYQPSTKTIRASSGKQAFSCRIGQKQAQVNKKSIALDIPCQLQQNIPSVPLRDAATAFGAQVGWLAKDRIFQISTYKKFKVRIERVIDGDTMDIVWGGTTERIRLIGVDTPETVHPRLGEQPYGRQAANFSKSQLTGKEVWLELDVEARDRYQRLLGYLYLTNGTLFNALLVSEGYAQMMTYPPNVRYVNLYQTLQTNARQQQRGLWSITTVQPSVSYNQNKGCRNPQVKGNINDAGEKIYHVPGGSFYARTNAERMFCNEQEALAAGFRKSLR